MRTRVDYKIASSAAFLVGFIFVYEVYGKIKNFDRNHWLILIPLVFPLLGILFGIKSLFKEVGVSKLIPISILLINVLLGAYIFVAYAFSYWQF